MCVCMLTACSGKKTLKIIHICSFSFRASNTMLVSDKICHVPKGALSLEYPKFSSSLLHLCTNKFQTKIRFPSIETCNSPPPPPAQTWRILSEKRIVGGKEGSRA